MLSRLDDIIYPNRCEVIEIEASQRYIYPIYKNGSGSIKWHAVDKKYKSLFNEQIQKLSKIDIILRDPLSRFVSGVNTYVFNTKRDNPTLDIDTILYFVENYLFLNRHYSPQLGWLINLSKYTNKDTQLKLYSMESLTEFTPLTIIPDEGKILDLSTIERLKTNVHNNMYLRLDNLLLELVGQELTFTEILEYLKNKDPQAYKKLSCTVLD
jgi:hypothetical protein